MTKQQTKLRRNFFKRCDPNIANIAAMFESLPNIGFYIKDAEGRIIAINRFNCEMCNIPTPDFAIGKRSSDLFPHSFANLAMSRDNLVRSTNKPIVKRRYSMPANLSVGSRVISIYPLYGQNGEIAGTLCCYYCDKPDEIGPVWEDKFDAIIEYINSNIAKPLSLAKVANEYKMSVSNLQRMFMRILGIRPGKYIIQQRLNVACRMLEETDKTVNDIAISSGFCDQSHFTKLFKQERKTTPGEYRRLHRIHA